MKHLHTWMSVFVLATALVVAGCGQADEGATLNVTSVPQAEVYVDGVSHGETGSALALPAGEHKIEVKLEGFTAHEETVTLAAGASVEREITLAAQDPSDPAVIAKLAAAEGVDVAPFVAPETHRGSRGKRNVAILLWPAKDVRKGGLVNYAVEADETYEGDATLEFRHGRKVLYRQSFDPERTTTIRPIPAEVLEHIKVGRKITWGLYFEDSRRPIKTQFKVVQRPKAERQLDKLAKSRHMQRQPQITQEIMAATVLENNRLYTEALVANLTIATKHKDSTQPYRGVVTTLRRLDAEDSELFALASQFVGGKGGRSGVARPSGTARTGGNGIDAGIANWSPIQKGALPAPVVDTTPGTSTARPGGQGVTPTGGAKSDGTTAPSESGTSTPTADRGAEAREHELQRMRDAITAMDSEYKVAQDEAALAQDAARTATKTAEDAEATAKAADAAAKSAREAVENAASPTREQQEAMYKAGMAAEEAREAANAARQAAEDAQNKAREFEGKADELKQNMDTMSKALDQATGKAHEPVAPQAPTEGEAKAAMSDAEERASEARKSWDTAKSALEEARKAFAQDPSDENRNNLENAEETFQAAAKDANEKDKALEAAKRALESVGSQVQDANGK